MSHAGNSVTEAKLELPGRAVAFGGVVDNVLTTERAGTWAVALLCPVLAAVADGDEAHGDAVSVYVPDVWYTS